MIVRIFIGSLPCLVCNYCDYIKTWRDSSCSRYFMFVSGYLNSLICNKECKFTKEHLWPISEEQQRYPSFWLCPAILDHASKKSAAPNMSVAPVSGLGSFPASLGLTLRKAGGEGVGIVSTWWCISALLTRPSCSHVIMMRKILSFLSVLSLLTVFLAIAKATTQP